MYHSFSGISTFAIIVGIFIWIFLVIISGIGAYKRNRSVIGYIIMALLLSPLTAGFVLLMLGDKDISSGSSSSGSYRPISRPYKYYKEDLQNNEQSKWTCKKCGAENNVNDVACKDCGAYK